MRLQEKWIAATWPAPAHVRALTTTRGADGEPPVGFDIGGHGGSPASILDANRKLLQSTTTGSAGKLQWLCQVHGNRCLHATVDSCSTTPEADSAWTDEAGLGLAIQTADCVPVAIADDAGDRIGLAHGGWRGLVGGVIERLVASMEQGAGLMAWIGPAIGFEAYEVGGDVYEAVVSAFGAPMASSVFSAGARPGKWHLDLFALAERRLAAAGVQRVYGERMCTFSNPRFYSYRRDGDTGRMATVVWKRPRDSCSPKAPPAGRHQGLSGIR